MKGTHFAIFRSGKHNSLYLKVSFSMPKLFRPDFEVILLIVRELPLLQAFLKNLAHFLRAILLVPIDQVISENQRTQGNKGQKGISLDCASVLLQGYKGLISLKI